MIRLVASASRHTTAMAGVMALRGELAQVALVGAQAPHRGFALGRAGAVVQHGEVAAAFLDQRLLVVAVGRDRAAARTAPGSRATACARSPKSTGCRRQLAQGLQRVLLAALAIGQDALRIEDRSLDVAAQGLALRLVQPAVDHLAALQELLVALLALLGRRAAATQSSRNLALFFSYLCSRCSNWSGCRPVASVTTAGSARSASGRSRWRNSVDESAGLGRRDVARRQLLHAAAASRPAGAVPRCGATGAAARGPRARAGACSSLKST